MAESILNDKCYQELLRRFSTGFYARCATLFVGPRAPQQLMTVAAKLKKHQADAADYIALKQLEPGLRCISDLIRLDVKGLLLLIAANLVIIIVLRNVLQHAARLGLLDPCADTATDTAIFAALQRDQQQQQADGEEEEEQALQGPAGIEALAKVCYQDIELKLSPAWTARYGVVPGKPLGRGGYAEAFAACWNGQLVVVKRLKVEAQGEAFAFGCESSAQVRQQQMQNLLALFKEAEMQEASRHVHVVQCLAVCRDTPALVMEWCFGGSLSQPTGRFQASATAADVLKLLHDAAAAVRHLHSQNRRCRRALVHGDLRACNLLLASSQGPDWNVKVADFGLAEWLSSDGTASVQTITNRCWLAPEVLEPDAYGPYRISKASEVYMFGMLMYEVLTGKAPYWDALLQLPLRRRELVPYLGNPYKEFGMLELPPKLRCQFPLRVQHQLQELFKQCTLLDPTARPDISTVQEQLVCLMEEAAAVSQEAAAPEAI